VVSRVFARPSTPGLLLYFKVGSGKTLASIAAAENLALAERRRRTVVVVAPASLLENYRKELEAARVDASKYRLLSFQRMHRAGPEEAARLCRDAVLVVDEAQNLRGLSRKADKGKTVRTMLEASRAAHKRLLLSGTPVMNYPRDIAGLLAMIHPSPDVVEEMHDFDRVFGLAGDRDRARLDELLRCTTLYYEPSAAVLAEEYPRTVDRTVYVEMTGRQADAHVAHMEQDMWRFELRELLEGTELGHAFLTHPREICTSLGRDHPKIDAMVAALGAAHAAGHKCVVHSSYVKHGLAIARQQLRAAGIECEAYDGSLSAAEKAGLVRRYNEGALRVLMLSDAGGEGIDLKNTAEVHLLEPAWNVERTAQVIGRAVRYRSHESLPRSQRLVRVFRYVATFPRGVVGPRGPVGNPGNQLPGGGPNPMCNSADQVLEWVCQRKRATNDAFLDHLVRVSDANVRRCQV
jgi:SNF2 family DNA or RNA helicase